MSISLLSLVSIHRTRRYSSGQHRPFRASWFMTAYGSALGRCLIVVLRTNVVRVPFDRTFHSGFLFSVADFPPPASKPALIVDCPTSK